MLRRTAATLLAFCAALPSPAQAKVIALKAARLFDGRGDRTAGPAVVLVEDGKIKAVGGVIPPDAEVIDLGDATLLPGLIDAHTHLSDEASDDWKQDFLDGLRRTPAEQALFATEHVRKTLLAGVTTCRNVGADGYVDLGLRNAIRARKIEGPRMLIALHAIGATGGHCDDTGYRPGAFGPERGIEQGVANGADAVRAAVRMQVKYGADVIKVCATGGVLSLADDVDSPQMTPAELEALVDEAHAWKRRVAAHAHGAVGAKRAIRAGVDSIEHGTFLDDEGLDLMKVQGTYLVPTLMAGQGLKERLSRVSLPPEIAVKAQAALERFGEVVRKAHARGIRIAFGTDAAVYPHGRNAEELHLLVEAGLQPAEALRAATSVSAELLGVGERLGVLEPGKIADVIAAPGDPLVDVRAVERVFFVMKDGIVYKHEKPRPAPPVTDVVPAKVTTRE